MKKLSSVGILLLWAGLAGAQDRAVLEVDTNYPEAIVYVDTVRMGPARWRTFVTGVGLHTIRLLAPGEAAWSVAPVERAVVLVPGDTAKVRLVFPLYHRVESVPSGAVVHLREGPVRRMLGRTPVTYKSKASDLYDFVVELSGYSPAEVTPGRDVWNRYVLRMQPLEAGSGPEARLLAPVHKRRRWIEVSAAALVVAGGVLTVHHKFKADRLNDHYQATGDPALRPRIARLDDRAAIALVGMQVGLVTLGVRFYLKK